MANPTTRAPGRKRIKRGPGQRIVDGKSFRLADEVRYIQQRAAEHDGRIVSIGQLVLFSTETGDAWLLDPLDHLAVRLARDPSQPISRTPTRLSRSSGRGNTTSREGRLSTSTVTVAG